MSSFLKLRSRIPLIVSTTAGLLILSFATGLIYNAMPPVGPLWLVLFWLSVYVCINVYRIATKLAEARKVRLTEEEAELRDTVLPEFTPVEFHKGTKKSSGMPP